MGTDLTWERHNDRAAVFRVKRLEGFSHGV